MLPEACCIRSKTGSLKFRNFTFMSTEEQKILNNYFGLLEGLSTSMKLNLIERLKASVQKPIAPKSKLKAAYGAWESDESAEELIKTIRSSRNTNRQIEEF